MTTETAIKMGAAAIAAGLFFCGHPLRAEEGPGGDALERLIAYEAAISSSDPKAAAAFLKDREARELAEANPRANAVLLGKAEALKDLKDLMDLDWKEAGINQLNRSLTIRIDAGKPLARLGLGPEPEKLLPWLWKYARNYTGEKEIIVKKAIREWGVIFGTMTETCRVDWGQADGRNAVTVTRESWGLKMLRDRNAIIEKLTDNDRSFLIYNDDRLSAMKDQNAANGAVRQVLNSGVLTQAQEMELFGKTDEEKLILLGKMFDRNEVAAAPELKTKINSARSSLPKEVLSPENMQTLGTMLNTSVAGELAGAKAGDRALAAFPGGLRVEVAPLATGYSRYDAASGTIILDAETIQQYMRLKGYTAQSVMGSKEQLAEIAKYMAPSVVYESAHKLQADWAAKKGVYKPRTQEDEIEAMSLEGLYTTEKMRKDPAFKGILTSSRDFSTYASKKMDIGTEFELNGSRKFANTVRQRYFSGLPSLDAAAAQVLGAVTEELERRDTMPAAQKAALDANGLTLEEALAMSPDELASSAGEIQTPVLAKIQGDLSRLGVYKSRYGSSDRQNRKALKSLEAGAGPQKSGAPPVPV